MSMLRRAQEEAMEVDEFDEIEKLQHQGINAGDIKARPCKLSFAPDCLHRDHRNTS
jgi:hypothetical protein